MTTSATASCITTQTPTGNTLSATWPPAAGLAHGSLTLNSDGSFTYMR